MIGVMDNKTQKSVKKSGFIMHETAFYMAWTTISRYIYAKKVM